MLLDSFRQLAKKDINIEWIVENLITPGGWTFLVGETGVGKSIMTIQLCDALQEGKPFLGFPTKRHNCLYIQADSGLIEWRTQIARYASTSAAWTAHQLERGFLDEEKERKRLKTIVWGDYDESHPAYRALLGKPFTFIIFDCLHAITNQDINTKVGMSTVLKHLDEIVTYTHGEGEEKVIDRVHFLLIHHPNAMVKRGATAGSGHKGFSDACSTKLTLGGELLVLEKSKLTSKKDIPLERATDGRWIPEGQGRLREVETFLGVEDMQGAITSNGKVDNNHLVDELLRA